MTGALAWIAMAGLGAVLGTLNALALWWSVRTFTRFRHPGAWLIASMPLRLLLTLAPLFGLAGGQLDRLLVGLVGFIAMRVLAVKVVHARGAGSIVEGAP